MEYEVYSIRAKPISLGLNLYPVKFTIVIARLISLGLNAEPLNH
jgi:hypothetical protein